MLRIKFMLRYSAYILIFIFFISCSKEDENKVRVYNGISRDLVRAKINNIDLGTIESYTTTSYYTVGEGTYILKGEINGIPRESEPFNIEKDGVRNGKSL